MASNDPYNSFDTLRVRKENGVAWVTIDHPPINLIDIAMMSELDRLGKQLYTDNQVRVVVFDSANPDFFMAHFDLNPIRDWPVNRMRREPSPFATAAQRFRDMPKATIGKVKGIARGGGSEFILALDMCFAQLDKAVFNQIEVAIGIVPGGGGSQNLPRVAGRNRALEAILSARDYSAELAEKYGWINRALPGDEIDEFVRDLAERIAKFPAETIAAVKRAVDDAEKPLPEGLTNENNWNTELMRAGIPQPRIDRALQHGAQTVEGEMDFETIINAIDQS